MKNVLLAVAATICAMPALSQTEPGDDIGGIGTATCEDISGVENLPLLAQATDWGLGYLAGRQDGGQDVTEAATLSTADPADVAIAIGTYCREYPYALVLDAARDYGLDVFAEGPRPDPALGPDLPNRRPAARPEDWPPAAAIVANVQYSDGQSNLIATLRRMTEGEPTTEDRLSTQSRPSGVVPGLRPMPRPDRI
ncbi:hypothetical protein BCF33_1167 [Hasllibacter halocynthiae]|uniref:Uncharacterized protein n=1 Tax=Hasllibacter halocynthiae TaxID=595589 RepID=A0A2T0X9D0_9RHOB|nr:hypothetical protein [Hasllibacter halocynthiae]PRY95546.1 hypothetical protein BCF33_1167 [Hasllibacter halocynthiae]